MPTSNPALQGKRILVVEDEAFLAEDMVRTLERQGADVVGPVPSLEGALALLQQPGRLDGAVLDVSLRGAMVFPVADILTARGIPFLFATGYADRAMPPRYRHVVRCDKPVEAATVAQTLFGETDVR